MPTLMLVATAVTIFSAGLFGYLRYLAYLRTMRWVIEQFGPEGIAWATALAPKGVPAWSPDGLGLWRRKLASRASRRGAASTRGRLPSRPD